MVTLVLREIAASPQLEVGRGPGFEIEAVVSAIANAMTSEGTDLRTAKGWPTITSAATQAAARNPGRLFRIENGATGGIGILHVRGVLQQARQLLGADKPPVLGGAVLTEFLVESLNLASTQAMRLKQVEQVLGVFQTLARESATPDGLIMPAGLPIIRPHPPPGACEQAYRNRTCSRAGSDSGSARRPCWGRIDLQKANTTANSQHCSGGLTPCKTPL
jgi:hypothetical protein